MRRSKLFRMSTVLSLYLMPICTSGPTQSCTVMPAKAPTHQSLLPTLPRSTFSPPKVPIKPPKALPTIQTLAKPNTQSSFPPALAIAIR